MIVNSFKNPLSVWLVRLIRTKLIEFKNKKKYLKLGYMSNVVNSSFGQFNSIYDNVFLDEVSLGDFTYVADSTRIIKTVIGKFCSIGPDCKIGLGKHPSNTFVSTHPAFFSTQKHVEITFSDKNYFDEFDNITIGNDVWIGANVIILDGVTVSDGAIIAAGSVVTKDVSPYAIVGGIPATIIKYRFKEKDISRLLELKWWDMDIEYLKTNFNRFHDIKNFP